MPQTLHEAHAEAAKREREFFDAFTERLGDFNPFRDRAWRNLKRRFEQYVRPAPDGVLLDVGCGTGESRRIYQEGCRTYVGLDISAMALARARRRDASSRWLQGDACRLPFAGATFDVVAFSSVLHHIPDFSPALREAHRVLKPGGKVFAFDPNLLHPAMALFRHPRSPLYSGRGVSPNEHPLTPGALRRRFAKCGFVSMSQRCLADLPYRAVALRTLNTFVPLYNAADWLLERSGLGRWFGSFVMTTAAKPQAPSRAVGNGARKG